MDYGICCHSRISSSFSFQTVSLLHVFVCIIPPVVWYLLDWGRIPFGASSSGISFQSAGAIVGIMLKQEYFSLVLAYDLLICSAANPRNLVFRNLGSYTVKDIAWLLHGSDLT